MVNKKGFIKTIEAVVAVIIIIIVSFTLIPRYVEQQPEPPLVVQDSMKFINNKIELDNSLRTGIINKDVHIGEELAAIIREYKPRNYDFTCAICQDSNRCIIDTPLKRSVYVTDLFIASSENKEPDPKIVRIWFWEGVGKMSNATYDANDMEVLGCYDKCGHTGFCWDCSRSKNGCHLINATA